ncbi:hypothetical protein NDU88_004350 [Pleurodeles waltl]|uniref:Uncharacterized protein n=1 Tax=Pleurodeles waltl TaxID=8319 RepID=A0AAV7UGW0_PLEWA|nr:hypothetical protein NDU88_004350 [Pleurodeles waltl]
MMTHSLAGKDGLDYYPTPGKEKAGCKFRYVHQLLPSTTSGQGKGLAQWDRVADLCLAVPEHSNSPSSRQSARAGDTFPGRWLMAKRSTTSASLLSKPVEETVNRILPLQRYLVRMVLLDVQLGRSRLGRCAVVRCGAQGDAQCRTT